MEDMATTQVACTQSMGRETTGSDGRRSKARRRRISQDDGRALEILGHAIDYLSDEFIHRGGSLAARDPHVQAVQLLMKLNREIYLSCPEAPSLADRFRTLLRRTMASAGSSRILAGK